MSPNTRKLVKGLWVASTRSGTNWPVQTMKMARSLKYQIYEEDWLYYMCSINKGADQLCSYCTADLQLCFCIGKKSVLS